jgi:hypothetical protein
VTRIGEIGTTLAVTSNRSTQHRDNAGDFPPKRWFLQEPHGITSQKTPFFIVTAVKTSNLTHAFLFSLKMDTVFSSESSVDLYRTTRRFKEIGVPAFA